MKEWYDRLKSKSLRVGVVGLGYVGLPLGLAFAEKGFSVLGFDRDKGKTEMLNRGEGYIKHLNPRRVTEVVRANKMGATDDFGRLGETDVVIICVPTPLTKNREPDLTAVTETTKVISAQLKRGQLVVLESTTYPGTTDGIVREILDRSGLRVGTDYFLAFSPEREDPGNKDYSTTTIPKVVGGVDEASGSMAASLYGEVVDQVVPVASTRVAEATKITENVFRAVNIALVNELKVIYERMGVDVRDVLDAAATKPFGFMRFDPGPGLGGHCIPLDPFYLTWKAREFGVSTRFIELAGEINASMPSYVVTQTAKALNDAGKAVRGARILLLGVAYKPDIDDPRESPAFELMDQYLGMGAEIAYHDPHIPTLPAMRSWPELPTMDSTPLSRELLEAQDVVVVVTHHEAVDYDLVWKYAVRVVDTRGVFRRVSPKLTRA